MTIRSEISEDLIAISKSDNESFNTIIEYLSNNKIISYEDIIEYENFCQKNNLQYGLQTRRFLKFYATHILSYIDQDEGKRNLDQIIALSVKDNKDVISGWERVKSNHKKIEHYLVNVKFETLSQKFPRLESFEIINDLRPVFDRNRENVVGYLYPMLLKIRTLDDKEMVLEIYEGDLKEIKEELDMAQKKLRILNKEE